MPRTRSLAWSELKIGIVAVVAITLAIMLIVAVGGQVGFAWQRYELRTRFADVQGLSSGAVVRVAGVDVGRVSAVDFVGPEVEVVLSVNRAMRERITTESRASIGAVSLLGEPLIDISPSTEGRPLEPGEYVPSRRPVGQLADVAEGATIAMEQATALLSDLRAGRGTVGRLFTDDELYREMTEFVEAARIVTTHISRGDGTLGMLTRDPQAYQRLNNALGNLDQMTRRINAGEGTLGRLLHDDAIARSLASATGNVDQLTARLNKGEGTAGRLLTDQQLYDRFNSLAGRVDDMAANLSKGQGTAGALLHDRELYENMNAAANELRALVGDIRKDPRRYLNVRVSIF